MAKSEIKNSVAMMIETTVKPIEIQKLPIIKATNGLVSGIR